MIFSPPALTKANNSTSPFQLGPNACSNNHKGKWDGSKTRLELPTCWAQAEKRDGTTNAAVEELTVLGNIYPKLQMALRC